MYPLKLSGVTVMRWTLRGGAVANLSATASTQAMRPFEWSTGRRNGPKPHGGCSGRPLVEWATSPSGAKIPLHLCYPLLIRLVERPLLDGQQEKFWGKAITHGYS